MKKNNIKIYIFFLITSLILINCEKTKIPQTGRLSPNQKAVEQLILSAKDMPCEILDPVNKNRWSPVSTEKLLIDTSFDNTNKYRDLKFDSSVDPGIYRVNQTYNVTTTPEEITTLQPFEQLYPGCLVQGSSLLTGVPTVIPIHNKRKLGRIRLNKVCVAEGDNDAFYADTYFNPDSVSLIIKDIVKNNLKQQQSRTRIKIEPVSSMSEMKAVLGLNLRTLGNKLETTFGENFEESKSYVAVMIDQEFFTISYDGPSGGFVRGTFTEDIKVEDIQPYTKEGNPMCYVKSVTYGRRYIVLYESEVSQSNLYDALTLAYGISERENLGCLTHGSYRGLVDIVTRSKYKLLKVGGDPKEDVMSYLCDRDRIKKNIKEKTIDPSVDIVVPISYKICQLSNDSLVRLANTFNFVSTKRITGGPRYVERVKIDIMALKVRTTPTKDNYNVSNNSMIKVNEIKVYEAYITGGNWYQTNNIRLDSREFNVSTTLDYPMYPLYSPTNNGFDYKYKLNISFDIYGEQIKRGPLLGDVEIEKGVRKTVNIEREYVWDKSTRQWRIDKDTGNVGDVLNQLIYKEKNGGVNFEVILDFMLTSYSYYI